MPKKDQDAKRTRHVICESCDSEYKMTWEPGIVSDVQPVYCSFCGEELEHPDPQELDWEEQEDGEISDDDY